MMILVNSDLKCDVSEIVSVSIIRQWLLHAKDNDHLQRTGFITGISVDFVIFTYELDIRFWFWNKIYLAWWGILALCL
jgi:hypothetical protein